MFAGIVTHVGRIASSKPFGDGLRHRIVVEDFALDEVKIGDSIAIQGVCHTVVAKDAGASTWTRRAPRSTSPRDSKRAAK